MNKLIVYLPTGGMTAPSWALVSEELNIIEVVCEGSPEKLSSLSKENEIIVIVPAEDVLLAEVNLPKISRAKLLQALPYALEDQLVEEVDKLHFALGDGRDHPGGLRGHDGDGQAEAAVACAVVAKEKLQSWLACLQSFQVEPDVLLPLTLALPKTAEQWHIIICGLAVVRTGLCRGFACDPENLNPLLALAFGALSPETLPERVHLNHYFPLKETLPQTDQGALSLSSLPIAITEEQKPVEQYYADIALSAAAMRPTINLLQGEYRCKKPRLPHMQKAWTFCAYLALAWVGLLLLCPTLSYFMLKARASHIQSQIAGIYQHHFPQATGMVAPKLRMEERLHQISMKNGEDKFLVLIGYLGKGKLEIPNVRLKRLDFQQGQLSLQVASSSDDLAKLVTFLTRQGLKVTQQNTELAGTGIQAMLAVE